MRRTFLLMLLTIFFTMAKAQEITLEKCQELARQNHPLLKQSGVIDDITALRQKSIQSSNLPQIDLTGRATYQSEVTTLAIPIPNIKPTELSKDQYKMYVEIKQKIYDFGLTKNRKQVEEADRIISQQQNETELYKIRETVNSLYFQALVLQENERIILTKNQLLDERIGVMGSAVRNGMGQANDLDNLKAERLLTEQLLIETRSGKKSTADILALITGTAIPAETVFAQPATQLSTKTDIASRPEIKLFAQQKIKLDASNKLLETTQLPNIFAFGQAGYGRPGLNMLNNNFKEWYMLGVGLSWNLWNGNKTKNDKLALSKQKQIVDIQQENFERAINTAIIKENNQLEKLSKLIETDQQVLKLKETIAKRSASALDNGTITSADYLRDENASLQAKINLSIHQIMILQSRENLRVIRGE